MENCLHGMGDDGSKLHKLQDGLFCCCCCVFSQQGAKKNINKELAHIHTHAHDVDVLSHALQCNSHGILIDHRALRCLRLSTLSNVLCKSVHFLFIPADGQSCRHDDIISYELAMSFRDLRTALRRSFSHCRRQKVRSENVKGGAMMQKKGGFEKI